MEHKHTISTSKSRRALEDLNLIDDFLFQQLLLSEEDGEEFCRILLRVILGKNIRNVKIIPQKTLPGIDTDRHGICMDAYIEEVLDESPLPGARLSDAKIIPNIYDIEPNTSDSKSSLPRRARYYQSLIDAQLFECGLDYNRLHNVITIMITNYDPFDRDFIMYTVKNTCTEAPDLPYNDGSLKIYLYTHGTKNCPSQELSDMLHYIENSKDCNVTNPDIASLDSLVRKVKHNRKVGISYMKSWEREAEIRNEGKQEGEKRFLTLTSQLLSSGRTEDLQKAVDDDTFREQLYKEFAL